MPPACLVTPAVPSLITTSHLYFASIAYMANAAGTLPTRGTPWPPGILWSLETPIDTMMTRSEMYARPTMASFAWETRGRPSA